MASVRMSSNHTGWDEETTQVGTKDKKNISGTVTEGDVVIQMSVLATFLSETH